MIGSFFSNPIISIPQHSPLKIFILSPKCPRSYLLPNPFSLSPLILSLPISHSNHSHLSHSHLLLSHSRSLILLPSLALKSHNDLYSSFFFTHHYENLVSVVHFEISKYIRKTKFLHP